MRGFSLARSRETQRPREEQQGRYPKDHVPYISRGPPVVTPRDHKLTEHHVSKIQSLTHL
ncbi:hypothetical protein E2C01_013047 [Portunus trituberculatus]|uniref:Uncharacterized protein n=1 Tax=Portunus trituberculatus TaxID=210409 RepID=A0A5B7DGB0_PORTR|nr:hypothetical protein [Portunus trituberculatus]